jgi:hypothetical protein
MTLSSSYYLRVNVPYVHLLPEYRPQLDILLPPKDSPKFLVCFVMYDNLPQFDFGEFPQETKPPAFLNETQLVHIYLSSNKETLI